MSRARDALAYEWVRIRTIRSTWWLTGLSLVFAYGVTLLVSWSYRGYLDSLRSRRGIPPEETAPMPAWLATQFGAAPGAPYVLAFVLAMVGILAWGHEYRHGMIRATLTALPSRPVAWAAKTVVALGWIAAVTALAVLGSYLLAFAFLHGRLDFAVGDLLGLGLRTVVYDVLFAGFGMGLTSLLRNQTVGLVLLFLWPLAIETVVKVLFVAVPGLREVQEVTRFLPFTAANRVLEEGFGPPGSVLGDPLSPLGGGLVMGTVVASLLGAGFVLFSRRDA